MDNGGWLGSPLRECGPKGATRPIASHEIVLSHESCHVSIHTSIRGRSDVENSAGVVIHKDGYFVVEPSEMIGNDGCVK